MAKELPADSEQSGKGVQTRRSFLGKLGLGAAALAAVSAVPFLKLGQKSSKDSVISPGPDSIFQPRQDPRN